MFTATFKEIKPFQHLVALLKDIVSEGVLQCHADGLRLQAMDTSHVVLCAFELSANAFATYNCQPCEQSLPLGISFSILHTILKTGKAEDTLTLQAQSSDRLELSFANPNNNQHVTYCMHLMQLDIENFAISPLPYATTIQMPSVQLHNIFKDLLIMGDTCAMTAGPNCLQFVTAGDAGSARVCLHHHADTPDAVHITANQSITLTFALKYLLLFSKAHTIDERVVLHLEDDVPMQLVYRLGEYGAVCFHIAPRYVDS